MGASSVTGVGIGGVEGTNAGSKHWTVSVGRLIGPRVMAADFATLSSGAASVILPALSGVSADYIVHVTDTNASATAVSGSLAISGDTTTLTLAGTGSHVLAWSIIKVGLSL